MSWGTKEGSDKHPAKRSRKKLLKHTIRRKDQLNEKETRHGPDENALIKTHIVCALYGIRLLF